MANITKHRIGVLIVRCSKSWRSSRTGYALLREQAWKRVGWTLPSSFWPRF